MLLWKSNEYYIFLVRICILGIQHAMRMRRAILSYLPFRLHHIFPTLSHKLQYFRENVTEHKMCVLIFSTTFV